MGRVITRLTAGLEQAGEGQVNEILPVAVGGAGFVHRRCGGLQGSPWETWLATRG